MDRIEIEFRKRKRNQWIVAAILIPVLFILAYPNITENKTLLGIDMEAIAPYMLIPVALGLVYSIYNWRCPSCRKYLGRSLWHKNCPHCGVSFQSNNDDR